MKKLYYTTLVLLLLFTNVKSDAENSITFQAAIPDTTGGAQGWRYATQADVNYWSNVSIGDVILFGKTEVFTDIPAYPSIIIRTIYTNYARMPIQGGKKIHIWRGNYGHISIFAKRDTTNVRGFVEQNSSETNPVVITNLGGQVQFGNYGKYGLHSGSFSVGGFKYVFISGEYDPILRTGDPNYRGLDGDLTTHGWINRFGIFGDGKYAAYSQGNASNGLGVTARSFLSVKIRGVSAVHGFFTGFSIKSDDIKFGDHTKIDIQKCVSGWHEGEGFYLGSTSGDPNSVPDNLIICKNNVVLFAGAEGIQADKLSKGSEIKNNFVYKTACFYQVPFQGSHYQENGFQWTFVEGGVRAENNILYTANAGGMINGSAIVPKNGVTVVPSDIVFSNNLLGPSKRGISYIQCSPGDPQGLVKFYFSNNVIDSITVPETNDAYTDNYNPRGFIEIANDKNQFYVTNTIYPPGRSLYVRSASAPAVVLTGSIQRKAPVLHLHDQFGFDPKEILNFHGVWLTGQYNEQVTNTGAIAYKKGDMVFMMEGGVTKYYKCIQAHNTVKRPSVETAYWQKLSWNGKDEPTYTPLLKADTYYNYKGMGLTYNPINQHEIDTILPVITVQRQYNFRVGNAFQFPKYAASDNRDGNITSKVQYSWRNGYKVQVDANNKLIAHGQYELILKVEDNAGNRTEPFSVKIVVSDQTVVLKNKSQLNLHTNSRANLLTPGNYWTDIAEDNAGLKVASAASPIVTTQSILKDTTGALLPWTVKIDDFYDSGYSRFFGAYDNGAAAYAIKNFPKQVTKEGLMLREGIETECHIIFRGLDTSKYYDFQFTGLRTGTGEINMAVADSASGQKVIFNIINNTRVYELTNLKPSAQGKISIINTILSGAGQWAESALSGFIITEKQGLGIIGNDTDGAATTAQIHFSYGGSPTVNQPGDYWNAFTFTNSNRTYTLPQVIAKDGATVTPLRLSVLRNGTEGFNYFGNTGLITGNNSGVVPDIILQNFAGTNCRTANIHVAGLSTSKQYTIQTLSNGRLIWEGQNYIIGVTVQDVKKTQNFTPRGGNTSNLLEWNNVSPDVNGKILISVAAEGQAFGVINALIIKESSLVGAGSVAAVKQELESSDEGLLLYPVPATDAVTVFYDKELASGVRSLKVADPSGKMYPVKVLSTDDHQWSIDTSSLHGFYILIIETENDKLIYKKFVVH